LGGTKHIQRKKRKNPTEKQTACCGKTRTNGEKGVKDKRAGEQNFGLLSPESVVRGTKFWVEKEYVRSKKPRGWLKIYPLYYGTEEKEPTPTRSGVRGGKKGFCQQGAPKKKRGFWAGRNWNTSGKTGSRFRPVVGGHTSTVFTEERKTN